MSVSTLKAFCCTMAGIIGSFVAKIFGDWTEDMITLVIFMAVDFVMGLIVAGVFHKSDKSQTGSLNSYAGWRGLCKKCVTFLFVILSKRLDLMFGTDYILTATVIGFITNEAISIIENAGLMGLPLPSVVTKAIEVLREESENGNNF